MTVKIQSHQLLFADGHITIRALGDFPLKSGDLVILQVTSTAPVFRAMIRTQGLEFYYVSGSDRSYDRRIVIDGSKESTLNYVYRITAEPGEAVSFAFIDARESVGTESPVDVKVEPWTATVSAADPSLPPVTLDPAQNPVTTGNTTIRAYGDFPLRSGDLLTLQVTTAAEELDADIETHGLEFHHQNGSYTGEDPGELDIRSKWRNTATYLYRITADPGEEISFALVSARETMDEHRRDVEVEPWTATVSENVVPDEPVPTPTASATPDPTPSLEPTPTASATTSSTPEPTSAPIPTGSPLNASSTISSSSGNRLAQGDLVDIEIATKMDGLTGTVVTDGLEVVNVEGIYSTPDRVLLMGGDKATYTVKVIAPLGENVRFGIEDGIETDGTKDHTVALEPWEAVVIRPEAPITLSKLVSMVQIYARGDGTVTLTDLVSAAQELK